MKRNKFLQLLGLGVIGSLLPIESISKLVEPKFTIVRVGDNLLLSGIMENQTIYLKSNETIFPQSNCKIYNCTFYKEKSRNNKGSFTLNISSEQHNIDICNIRVYAI